MKKHLALKIILSLLPALIFAQNYGWITLYKGFGIAFVIIWLLCVWLVWRARDKNEVLSELFRISEIGAFLLPISAIIMTFVVGAKFMNETTDTAEKVGAAIGTTIGGFMAVGISFVIGLFGGIILHLLANRFEKKIEKAIGLPSQTKHNFFERHKILTTIGVVIILLIVASIISSTNPPEKSKPTDSQIKAEETNGNQAASEEQKEEVFKIKENVPIKPFVFSVLKVKDMKEISDGFSKRKAWGIYKLVGIMAYNADKESRYVDNSMFKLVDNQGRKYDSSVEGGMTMSIKTEGETDLFLKQVNPSMARGGILVFDIPEDAEGLKLEISGGIGSTEKKYVDLESVVESDEPSGAMLGVRFITIDEKIQAENKLPYSYGALVLQGKNKDEVAVAPDSPADKAGIRENDIILEVNGVKITTDNFLTDVIGRYKIGEVVKLKVWQKGEEKEFWVELTGKK